MSEHGEVRKISVFSEVSKFFDIVESSEAGE